MFISFFFFARSFFSVNSKILATRSIRAFFLCVQKSEKVVKLGMVIFEREGGFVGRIWIFKYLIEKIMSYVYLCSNQRQNLEWFIGLCFHFFHETFCGVLNFQGFIKCFTDLPPHKVIYTEKIPNFVKVKFRIKRFPIIDIKNPIFSNYSICFPQKITVCN